MVKIEHLIYTEIRVPEIKGLSAIRMKCYIRRKDWFKEELSEDEIMLRKGLVMTDFSDLLHEKFEKWCILPLYPQTNRERDFIEFTLGRDDNYQTIAIVHPKDHFNKKIGAKIVTGRLRRMNGQNPYDLSKKRFIREVSKND